jgi:hypothetical protein
MAVDGATWLSYARSLPKRRGHTTVGFLSGAAVGCFKGKCVECRQALSDDVLPYKSHE